MGEIYFLIDLDELLRLLVLGCAWKGCVVSRWFWDSVAALALLD